MNELIDSFINEHESKQGGGGAQGPNSIIDNLELSNTGEGGKGSFALSVSRTRPCFTLRAFHTNRVPTVYINQTGDEPQKQDTQATKRSPLLSEEVPYQITLIRL